MGSAYTKALVQAVLLGTALVSGCARNLTPLELTVETRSEDGRIVAGVPISISGEPDGESDHRGVYRKHIRRKAGAVVDVKARVERDGTRYHWNGSFVVERNNTLVRLSAVLAAVPRDTPRGSESQEVAAPLSGRNIFTILVQRSGLPVSGADVYIDGNHAGATDTAGVFRHKEVAREPREGTLLIDHPGLARWKHKVTLAPGRQFIVNLSNAHAIDWSVRTTKFGRGQPIPGAIVRVNGEPIGLTDADGEFFYNHPEADGTELSIEIEAPGFLPRSRRGQIAPRERSSFAVHFAPLKPPRARIGILPLVNTVTDPANDTDVAPAPADLVDGLHRGLSALGFVEVVSIDPLALAGQTDRQPPDLSSLDAIALLTVEPGVGGDTLEARLIDPEGELLRAALRVHVNARDAAEEGAAIARELMADYPVEGAITTLNGRRVKTNLEFGVLSGQRLEVLHAEAEDKSAWRSGDSDEVSVGLLRIQSLEAGGAVCVPTQGLSEAILHVGDRVILRPAASANTRTVRMIVQASGAASAVSAGVNVYLDGLFSGATDAQGVASLNIVPGRTYDLMLYKSGALPFADKIIFDPSTTERIVLPDRATLAVQSQPSGARVSVDDVIVGTTPIADPIAVPSGLRRLRVTKPGYKVWEKTVRLSGEPVILTQSNSITLFLDVLSQGAQLEAQGELAGAAALYLQATRTHPDFVPARTRRARLLLDSLNDPGGAIEELESVGRVPHPAPTQDAIHRLALLARAFVARSEKERAAAAALDLTNAVNTTDRALSSAVPDTLRIDILYTRALALHRLNALDGTPTTRVEALKAWDRYLSEVPPAARDERVAARKLREELL